MKNIFTTFFSLLIGVSLLAQSTFNDPNAEVRDVKGFHGIKVATGIQLVLTQGSTEAGRSVHRDRKTACLREDI